VRGSIVSWADVAVSETDAAIMFRREMERGLDRWFNDIERGS